MPSASAATEYGQPMLETDDREKQQVIPLQRSNFIVAVVLALTSLIVMGAVAIFFIGSNDRVDTMSEEGKNLDGQAMIQMASESVTASSYKLAASTTSSSQNTSRFWPYQMLYEDSANNWLPSQGYLYNYTDIDIDLNKVDLRMFRGNISIVSNVASF
jgi:hypothetical protein